MSSAPVLEWRLSECDLIQDGQPNDLGARIQDKLGQSAYYAVRRMVCDVRDGRLVLYGRLPAYLLRQVKQLVFDEVYRPLRSESLN